MHSIHIVRDTLPEAWEAATLACWREGDAFPTEYDGPDDPSSRDVAALIHVKFPMSDPRIHRGFPGGLNDLEKYRAEVLFGVHDHWVDLTDEAKWDYTYHGRFGHFNLPRWSPDAIPASVITGFVDQISRVIEQLKAVPHTRRCQMITWQPWRDPTSSEPPCLQRLWFRIERVQCPTCHGTAEIAHGPCTRCDNTGFINRLHMNAHIRSNDAFKAGFMNMYAFSEFQAMIAAAVSDEDGRRKVEVGEYLHFADSFHIYGSYFDEFEGFLKSVETRDWGDRVYTDEFAREFFVDGCNELLAEDDLPADKRTLVQARRLFLLGEGEMPA